MIFLMETLKRIELSRHARQWFTSNDFLFGILKEIKVLGLQRLKINDCLNQILNEIKLSVRKLYSPPPNQPFSKSKSAGLERAAHTFLLRKCHLRTTVFSFTELRAWERTTQFEFKEVPPLHYSLFFDRVAGLGSHYTI